MEAEANEVKEKDLFTIGNELYQQKAPLPEVIDVFLQAEEKYNKDSSVYTCLSWLYMLKDESGDFDKAISYAKTALRLDPGNIQAHVNLVLALLATGKKGVREQFEKVISRSTKQDLEHAVYNLKDALERKPEFQDAAKLLTWIESRM